MDDFLLYDAAREALQDDTDDESVDDVESDEEDDDFEIVDHLLLDICRQHSTYRVLSIQKRGDVDANVLL
jgi:hypothetical protein